MRLLVPYLVGTAILGIGMVLARLGYIRWERRSRLVETPPSSPGSVTERGVVEVEGTVEPAPDAPRRTVDPDADGTVPAPEGARAVALAWQGRDESSALGRVGFPARAAGFLSVPFYVSGPDGRVLVDPGTAAAEDVSALDYTGHDATVEVHGTVVDAGTVTLHPPTVVPTPLADLFTEWPALRGALNAVGVERDGYDTVGTAATRIGTAAVEPGDEVYVRGLARRDTGKAGGSSDLDDGGDDRRFDAADAVIARPYGDDPFVLSVRDKGALLDGLGGGHRLYRAGTAVALAGIAVVVLAMTGVFVWP